MADSQTATSAPEFKSAHFIGIGGAGMSGIALVLHERGYAVTGSDLKTSRYIRQLTRAGVKVHVGHEAATIDEVKPDVVVVSTAIPESNPELVRARELGIPVWPRAKMLSALGHGYTTVAVAGTHGKTTTSSMLASALDALGAQGVQRTLCAGHAAIAADDRADVRAAFTVAVTGLRQLAAAYPGHVAEDTGRVPAQETEPTAAQRPGAAPALSPEADSREKRRHEYGKHPHGPAPV